MALSKKTRKSLLKLSEDLKLVVKSHQTSIEMYQEYIRVAMEERIAIEEALREL